MLGYCLPSSACHGTYTTMDLTELLGLEHDGPIAAALGQT